MIEIGIALHNILSTSIEFTKFVGENNIFPQVAPDWVNDDTVKFPFIVYHRENLSPNYTKNGLEGDIVPVSINVFSKSYKKAVNIASVVRKALELFRGEVEGISINTIRLKNIKETYSEGVFIQRLDFEVKGGSTKDIIIYKELKVTFPIYPKILSPPITVTVNDQGRIIQTINQWDTFEEIENRYLYQNDYLILWETKDSKEQIAARKVFLMGHSTPYQVIELDYFTFEFTILIT